MAGSAGPGIDAVTWGLQRVEQDKQVLNKAEKHLKWATRHHYHVAGLNRWLRKHVAKQQTLRAMGVHFRSDRVLRQLGASDGANPVEGASTGPRCAPGCIARSSTSGPS